MSLTVREFWNAYQDGARTTAVYLEAPLIKDGTLSPHIYGALSLVSETGELAGPVTKMLRRNEGINHRSYHADLVSEIGDCLWSVAAICSDANIEMGVVMAASLKECECDGVGEFVTKQDPYIYGPACAITLGMDAAAVVDYISGQDNHPLDAETVENLLSDYLIDLELLGMTYQISLRFCAEANLEKLGTRMGENRI